MLALHELIWFLTGQRWRSRGRLDTVGFHTAPCSQMMTHTTGQNCTLVSVCECVCLCVNTLHEAASVSIHLTRVRRLYNRGATT